MYGVDRLRHELYQVLEQPRTGWASWIINGALALLIVLTVLAVILESESGFYRRYIQYFTQFERLSVSIFTVEYFVRIWISAERPSTSLSASSQVLRRLRYMITPMALIDLLAIAPYYLGMLLGGVDLRMLRSIRLLRILKLTRYSRAMSLLGTLIRQETETMLSALFIFLVLILISATGMYWIEGRIQPEQFGSIPKALWWAVVTLTTIGYGDAVPITQLGKVFAGITVIGGIAIASLPAAILSSGLINELKRRRETYRQTIYTAYQLGHLSVTALEHIEQQRQELGVSRADAQSIMREIQQEMRLATLHECPHCHKSLRVHHHAGHTHVHAHEDDT
ncbi:MAG: hypothetical protein RLZZ422_363 [Pseudomonadota bacterium]|jgi:voltage-gated potassium channel